METAIKHSDLTFGKSSNTATFEHNQTLNDNLEPISSAYVDLQGNLIQLWRWKVDTVIASVRDSHQKLSFVTGNCIHNALLPYETGKQLLNRLITTGPKHWHLAYTEGHIHVWPFLTAEAKKPKAERLDESHPGWQVVLGYKRAGNLAA